MALQSTSIELIVSPKTKLCELYYIERENANYTISKRLYCISGVYETRESSEFSN